MIDGTDFAVALDRLETYNTGGREKRQEVNDDFIKFAETSLSILSSPLIHLQHPHSSYQRCLQLPTLLTLVSSRPAFASKFCNELTFHASSSFQPR